MEKRGKRRKGGEKDETRFRIWKGVRSSARQGISSGKRDGKEKRRKEKGKGQANRSLRKSPGGTNPSWSPAVPMSHSLPQKRGERKKGGEVEKETGCGHSRAACSSAPAPIPSLYDFLAREKEKKRTEGEEGKSKEDIQGAREKEGLDKIFTDSVLRIVRRKREKGEGRPPDSAAPAPPRNFYSARVKDSRRKKEKKKEDSEGGERGKSRTWIKGDNSEHT